MRMCRSVLRVLCLAALFGVLAFQLSAQKKAKAAKAPKQSNIQGSVQSMDKSKMMITVRTGTAKRDVMYSADTKFMYGHSNNNKPGSVDQVKDNNYISCSGTYDKGKVELKATECVYRETK